VRLFATLLLTSALGSWTASAQSDPGTESNVSCVERLQMPYYPPLADQARISGTVTATVSLGTDGSIQNTTMDMGAASTTAKRLFPPEVHKALRASGFHKGCGGKSVTLVFHFVLGEQSDPHGLPQAVSFGYPNQFWISVPPMIAQP